MGWSWSFVDGSRQNTRLWCADFLNSQKNQQTNISNHRNYYREKGSLGLKDRKSEAYRERHLALFSNIWANNCIYAFHSVLMLTLYGRYYRYHIYMVDIIPNFKMTWLFWEIKNLDILIKQGFKPTSVLIDCPFFV